MKKLTALGVEKARYRETRSEGEKSPGVLLGSRVPDPEYPGLYLYISPRTGSKAFRFDFRFPPSTSGSRQTLTYGKYPQLSLDEAREKHRQAKRDLAAGVNPAAKKQEAKRTALSTLGNTYEKVSARWYERESTGKSRAWPVREALQEREKPRLEIWDGHALVLPYAAPHPAAPRVSNSRSPVRTASGARNSDGYR